MNPRQAPRTEAAAPAAAPAGATRPALPSDKSPSTPPPLAVDVADGTLYVCVVERDGRAAQSAIEFEPRVADLCRRHPEMGPCQYERNQCRARGGRVFATNRVEITMQTEAEYDKKVMRTRLRAN